MYHTILKFSGLHNNENVSHEFCCIGWVTVVSWRVGWNRTYKMDTVTLTDGTGCYLLYHLASHFPLSSSLPSIHGHLREMLKMANVQVPRGLLWPRLQKSHSISSIRFSWLKKIRRPAGWMDQQCQVTKWHAYWAERNLWPLSNLPHTYTLASSVLIHHVSRRIPVVMGLFLIVVTISIIINIIITSINSNVYWDFPMSRTFFGACPN